MSDETLQDWFTNMHNLSSLDKSIVRFIDVHNVLQHGFSFDPAKFRDFVPFVKLTLSDSSLTISRERSFIVWENLFERKWRDMGAFRMFNANDLAARRGSLEGSVSGVC